MRTGTILLGMDPRSERGRAFAERCRRYLISKGRKDVETSFYLNEGDPRKTVVGMHERGIDTFAVVPLTMFEGKHTVWKMPSTIGIPDNCGSWMMIGDDDVAVRFATAIGFDDGLSNDLLEREGTPRDDTAILLVYRRSPHSTSKRMSGQYLQAFLDRGWKASCSSSSEQDLSETIAGLMDDGVKELRIVPLLISFDGPSADSVRGVLKKYDIGSVIRDPISSFDRCLEIIDSKVPEGW